MNDPIDLIIDVFGHCNLRCPSCVVGNWTGEYTVVRKGLMSEELLESILRKALSKFKVQNLGLFNWSEPLLHPKLPRLIQICKSFGLNPSLSSNLNVLKNEKNLMESNPLFCRISVSGFTQEIYSIGHRNGNIEDVKENMRKLVAARDEMGATTKFQVLYHRYKYNLHEEALMQMFAESLGYEFVAVWAMMLPAEKIMAYLGKDKQTFISDSDASTISNLALDLETALAFSRAKHIRTCRLQQHQVVINAYGDVYLCCGVARTEINRIGHFLEMEPEDIQQAKQAHKFCSSCMECGIHAYFSEQDDFDKIAQHYLKDRV